MSGRGDSCVCFVFVVLDFVFCVLCVSFCVYFFLRWLYEELYFVVPCEVTLHKKGLFTTGSDSLAISLYGNFFVRDVGSYFLLFFNSLRSPRNVASTFLQRTACTTGPTTARESD